MAFHNGHFVLRQRTRFVATNDLRAAECFHSGQAADDSIAARHIGNTDRKNDGNDSRKSFGDRGDCKADGNHKGVHKAVKTEACNAFGGEYALAKHLNGHHNSRNADDEEGKNTAELSEFLLERRFTVLCLGKCVGDLTHLGIHTRCRDQHLAATVNHGAAHIYHIDTVTKRNILLIAQADRRHILCNGNAFARKRRFLNLHRCTFDDTSVGRNRVACFKDHYVANDDILALDKRDLSVANDL